MGTGDPSSAPDPGRPLQRLRISAEERQAQPRPFSGLWWAIAIPVAVLLIAGIFLFRSSGSGPSDAPNAIGPTSPPGPASSPSAPAAAPASEAALAASSPTTVVAGGRVEASGRRELATPRGGVVRAIRFPRGSKVKAGDVLLELDDSELQADLAQREAALAAARARLEDLRAGARPEELAQAERDADAEVANAMSLKEKSDLASRLSQSGAVPSSQVREAQLAAESAAARAASARARLALLRQGAKKTAIAAAEADLSRAQADVAASRARLQNARIVAPVDGTVLDVRVRVGEAIVPEAQMVAPIVLGDTSHLLVVADVPEARAALLAPGDPAEITVEAFEHQRFRGSVVEIAPEADRQKATLEVTVSLDNPLPLVHPRMAARVAITPKEKK